MSLCPYIYIYVKINNAVKAWQLLVVMLRKGLEQDLITYITLIIAGGAAVRWPVGGVKLPPLAAEEVSGTGAGITQVSSSPFLENLRKKGLEVLHYVGADEVGGSKPRGRFRRPAADHLPCDPAAEQDPAGFQEDPGEEVPGVVRRVCQAACKA